jgi:hypothetical protein
MPLRNTVPMTIKPAGLSDAIDGSNAFPGAMQQLENLVRSPGTPNMWVPRPSLVFLNAFQPPFFQNGITGFLVVGDYAYLMIQSTTYPGYDCPQALNLATGDLYPPSGINSGNIPKTAGSGLIMAQVGQRILVCHPGFSNQIILGPQYYQRFGWLDISNFTLSTTCTTTPYSYIVQGLPTNLIGIQPGFSVSGANIPAGAQVVAYNAVAGTMTITASMTGSTQQTGVAVTIAGGSPTNPLWSAGDTYPQNLPSRPVGVAQFNGRAYFACGLDGIVFSDSLLPCQRTNADQALTPSNGLAVTSLGPLMLSAPLTGGIVQSIIAFQGVTMMWQITGDQATNNLTMNALPVATGTLFPLSIVPCSAGLAFVSPTGLRIINFAGQVSDPIGANGTGITVPILNATYIAAATNADVIRVYVQRGDISGNPLQEFWFDLTTQRFSGPHTILAPLFVMTQPWRETFIVALTNPGPCLNQSDVVPTYSSSYTGEGTLPWRWQTTLLPDNQRMQENGCNEATIGLQLPASTSVTVTASDEAGNQLDSVTITTPAGYGGAFRQWPIQWHNELVFKQMTITVTGTAAAGIAIGDLRLRYAILGYQMQPVGGASE